MLEKLAQSIIAVFKYHKLKLLVVLLSALFFVVVLFPYDDLSDVMTAQIAAASNNQVHVQFDHLGIDVFPAPAIALEQVVIDSGAFPTLKAAALSVAPSIPALLTFRQGFVARAEGLFGGAARLGFSEGESIDENSRRQNIDLEIEEMNIADLRQFADLPIQFQGTANFETEMSLDPLFRDQPEGDINLIIRNLKMPPSTVPTQMGPIALPGLQWSNVLLKGRLVGGRLIIEDGVIGGEKDLFTARIRGQMDMALQRRGGSVVPNFGSYEFRVELNVNKALQKDLGLFLSLLGNYQSSTLNGSRFLFKASGTSFGPPPRLSSLPTFN